MVLEPAHSYVLNLAFYKKNTFVSSKRIEESLGFLNEFYFMYMSVLPETVNYSYHMPMEPKRRHRILCDCRCR